MMMIIIFFTSSHIYPPYTLGGRKYLNSSSSDSYTIWYQFGINYLRICYTCMPFTMRAHYYDEIQRWLHYGSPYARYAAHTRSMQTSLLHCRSGQSHIRARALTFFPYNLAAVFDCQSANAFEFFNPIYSGFVSVALTRRGQFLSRLTVLSMARWPEWTIRERSGWQRILVREQGGVYRCSQGTHPHPPRHFTHKLSF